MLTQQQRDIDACYHLLRDINSETRVNTMCAQMRLQKREQPTLPTTPRKSALELQLEAERKQRHRDRYLAAKSTMSPRYSTKARVDASVIKDCYDLKRRLPSSARKRFEEEYNLTEYGYEAQLIAKYKKLYNL